MPVLDNDTPAPGETLTLRSIIVAPENGDCFINQPQITYVPNRGFNGIDSCVYGVCDKQFQCDTATITFTVGSVTPPTPTPPTPPTPSTNKTLAPTPFPTASVSEINNTRCDWYIIILA